MKKISRVALAATFAATMLSPMAVFAEGEENNDYNEIYGKEESEPMMESLLSFTKTKLLSPQPSVGVL